MPSPDPSPAPSPLLTTTADALVAVDLAPRRAGAAGSRRGGQPAPRRTANTGPRNPYLRLFDRPGARTFTAANLVARLPTGMFGISSILLITGRGGSYALAGGLAATGLAAAALAGPYIARLVDRHGQARIAVPATLCAALGSLALLLCVRHGAPVWTWFAANTVSATLPNIGGLSRARWAHLLRDDPQALHTANSFEQAVDELCFMLGPVLAAFLCGTVAPEAGLLAALVLLVAGTLLFTAQRATEPPPRAARAGATSSPLRVRGIPPLLAGFVATGAVFGSMEVVTVAYADALGHRTAAGLVLTLQAVGSCAAGLLYGALRPAGPADRRLPWCLLAMAALMCLPLLSTRTSGGLPALAVALLIAGMATAPTMVTAMTVVQHRTPEGRLNEGMSLMVTGLLAGIGCGSAAGGFVVDHASAAAGFVVPVAAAGAALLIGVVRRG